MSENLLPSVGRPYRVGCALLPKKESRYLTPRIVKLAREKGIEMCAVDTLQPLSDQGPYDVIIHKRQMDRDWERNLEEFCQSNPNVKVIDNVDGIRLLSDRCTMLSILEPNGFSLQRPLPARRKSGGFQEDNLGKVVDRFESPPLARPDSPSVLIDRTASLETTIKVLAPPQVLVGVGRSIQEIEADLRNAGVEYPLVAKSQWADGREGSHLLAVVHDKDALENLLENGTGVEPPFVVQQYVEHGGVLHKVFVVGSQTECLQRPSLSLTKGQREGLQVLPRISCQPYTKKDSYRQLQERPPPEWVTQALAEQLRNKLGLQLFNFDMIKPQRLDGVYYVVDINYFPGVDKIQDFEGLFVEFLLATCQSKT